MAVSVTTKTHRSLGTAPFEARRTPALEVSGLRMRYGTTDVLKGVDLRVGPGEVVALLGPNGAGKTTTIEILEGLRKRSAGDVKVLGIDPDEGDESWRARLGIVLQSWRDHRRWRVRDFLDHIGRYYAPYGSDEHPRPYDTDELLAKVGLAPQATKVIGRLSGGQRRRLDVAIGLVGNPELLFLDEPTVGFDPEARNEFHEVITDLCRAHETSIVLTTHDLAEAEKLAQRIVILIDGRIVANGTAQELADCFCDRATVSYSLDGRPEQHQVENPTDFVRSAFEQHGPRISNLMVQPARLEETYLKMVGEFDRGVPAGASGSDQR